MTFKEKLSGPGFETLLLHKLIRQLVKLFGLDVRFKANVKLPFFEKYKVTWEERQTVLKIWGRMDLTGCNELYYEIIIFVNGNVINMTPEYAPVRMAA